MKSIYKLIPILLLVALCAALTVAYARTHEQTLAESGLTFALLIFGGSFSLMLVQRGTRKGEESWSASDFKIAGAPVPITDTVDPDRARQGAEQDAIYEIIKGVTSTDNLDELLRLIHRSIGRILNAENCFVALHNRKTDLLEMQFFVDKKDTVPEPFRVGRGLTAFVFRTGQAMLMTSAVIREFYEQGKIEQQGTAPSIWMGVPLRTREGIIGVLVVQHYEDEKAYTVQDLELMELVGDQIALAIDRKRAEEALRLSEEQHRLLFETNPQPAFVYDLETLGFLAVNDAAVRHYGYSRVEFLKDITVIDIRPEGDIEDFLERVSRVSPNRDSVLAPSRHQKRDGTVFDVEITSHPLVFAGRPAEIVLVKDFTQRKLAEKEAERLNAEIVEQRERFSSILENIPCVIWEMPIDPTDPDAPAPFVNSHVSRMYGYTPDEWLSTPDFWLSVVHPEDRQKRTRDHDVLFRDGEVTTQSRWLTKEQKIIWGETRIALIKDENGKNIGVRGMTTDITEQKSLEGQLTHQALHDPLTSLPNRVLFSDRVKHALDRSHRINTPVSVLFLDLDNFKQVNDTLGHAAGDQLLVSLTDRLNACLRAGDTPARLGGDEFAVLIEDTNCSDIAVKIAERIRTVLSEPYTISGKEVFIGTSIGIASSTSAGESPEELLRNADVAMYRSKTSGKNRCTVFESEMHDTILKRVRIEADMRLAIELGEFEVHYQPIVELDSERVIGFEALSRWIHPEHGVISPADFIPVAEETGMIVQIGNRVIDKACAQARKWQERSGEHLSVTVNIASRQFHDGDLFATVRDALAESGLPPNCLVLEITERTMLANTEATIQKLKELKSLGIRLAIDDFGTGYSSLSYLQRFPIDILKIDKSFVEHIANGKEGIAVAKAIITMSETLQLKTIAEGIECLTQSTKLRTLGCTLGQGYHFAKPLPAAEAVEFLNASATAYEDTWQDNTVPPVKPFVGTTASTC